jgi:hypothetical protein
LAAASSLSTTFQSSKIALTKHRQGDFFYCGSGSTVVCFRAILLGYKMSQFWGENVSLLRGKCFSIGAKTFQFWGEDVSVLVKNISLFLKRGNAVQIVVDVDSDVEIRGLGVEDYF